MVICITVAQQELDKLKGHVGKVLMLNRCTPMDGGTVYLSVANGEQLAAFTIDQVEEPPALTPVKDIHAGDVVECFNGVWNRAIVTHAFVPEDYVSLTRPHMHLSPHTNIPSTQYEQFRVYGPQVVIHE